jgi:hypothetical protein
MCRTWVCAVFSVTKLGDTMLGLCEPVQRTAHCELGQLSACLVRPQWRTQAFEDGKGPSSNGIASCSCCKSA